MLHTPFRLGIATLPAELVNIEVGRVFWVNADTMENAQRLVASTIAAQDVASEVVLVSTGESARSWLKLDPAAGPNKIRLLRLVETQEGLNHFFAEMRCIQDLSHKFLILFTSFSEWGGGQGEVVIRRLANLLAGCQTHSCAVLIVTYGNRLMLGPILEGKLNVWLSGFASLRTDGPDEVYQVSYWCNGRGVSAGQSVHLAWDPIVRWHRRPSDPIVMQPMNDSDLIVSNSVALEGLPQLSEHWKLMPSNHAVYEEALTLQAATIIFSIQTVSQIDEVLYYIHSLRLNRGQNIKLVVREMKKPILRFMDDTCFHDCGVSAITPWSAKLARFLVQITALRGQTIEYPSLPDIGEVLASRKLLDGKGYQIPATFCATVMQVLDNPIGIHYAKGVLVLLIPVSGLSGTQILSACHPQRKGDVMTLWKDSLVLFLPYCNIHDVDFVLNRFFGLAIDELFFEKTVIYARPGIESYLDQIRIAPPVVLDALPAYDDGPEAPCSDSGRTGPDRIVLFQDH